mmetsp:Transcript_33103/g.65953  ORF Transcript_33103/g.65953 Transcript_33103/m.65953 type:complete len:497 (+) Transcript_33103:467-1957(+)
MAPDTACACRLSCLKAARRVRMAFRWPTCRAASLLAATRSPSSDAADNALAASSASREALCSSCLALSSASIFSSYSAFMAACWAASCASLRVAAARSRVASLRFSVFSESILTRASSWLKALSARACRSLRHRSLCLHALPSTSDRTWPSRSASHLLFISISAAKRRIDVRSSASLKPSKLCSSAAAPPAFKLSAPPFPLPLGAPTECACTWPLSANSRTSMSLSTPSMDAKRWEVATLSRSLSSACKDAKESESVRGERTGSPSVAAASFPFSVASFSPAGGGVDDVVKAGAFSCTDAANVSAFSAAAAAASFSAALTTSAASFAVANADSASALAEAAAVAAFSAFFSSPAEGSFTFFVSATISFCTTFATTSPVLVEFSTTLAWASLAILLTASPTLSTTAFLVSSVLGGVGGFSLALRPEIFVKKSSTADRNTGSLLACKAPTPIPATPTIARPATRRPKLLPLEVPEGGIALAAGLTTAELDAASPRFNV